MKLRQVMTILYGELEICDLLVKAILDLLIVILNVSRFRLT